MENILKKRITNIIEKYENECLSPFAMINSKSRGRAFIEKTDFQFKTNYQIDVERIVHSKSFRRLKGKAQVFISPVSDHLRTRLTHTLEVSQISRTIARVLLLNENLCEAIALGHDLGHSPFGHKGEWILNKICPYGFKHNEHAIRVSEVLERQNGINLTYEVKDGILKHTGDAEPETLEGIIVRYADKIAYINHDIDDAIRTGLIKHSDIPAKFIKILGENNFERINTLVLSIIENSIDQSFIKMDEEIFGALMQLRKFMFENVYMNPKMQKDEYVETVVTALYEYYTRNSEEIPHGNFVLSSSESLDRIVCDYIAGMTDNFAVFQYENISKKYINIT